MNLKPYLLTGILILTTAFDWPSWLVADDGKAWAPLSDEEIADAHSCMMDNMLAVCAGEKRVATGIIISQKLFGKLLPSTEPVMHYRKGGALGSGDIEVMYDVDVGITFQQPATDTQSAWQLNYYILSDKQLANMIELARKDSTWTPSNN